MPRLRIALSFLVLAIAFQLTSSAEAGRPKFLQRLSQYRRANAPTYHQRYVYGNWRYPKYIGAFHASYFQSIGVPSGDIGFRGNGLYVTPW